MTELKAKRKGSRSIREIPEEILEQLNSGQIATANLVEWLAIDQRKLLEKLLHDLNKSKYLKPILADVDTLKKKTVVTINEAIGTRLLATNDAELLNRISIHTSDAVRCWATFTVSKNSKLSLAQIFAQIQPFAADNHFGVREIAWIAVRPKISENLNESLKFLAKWTSSEDENVRRFASEATRPRGVWCKHIETLKQNPELGLVVLDQLKSDEAKYVQDSVGNWLNDASKTQPKFVKELCEKWEAESKLKATAYIIKKALRTIGK
jgi:3-methyladenine DNA glycosylase AlkC